jgi:hypothetical protein
MQNLVTGIVVLVLALILGGLMFFLTTKVISYSIEQEKMAAEDVKNSIDEVLEMDKISLSDFIERFGEPENVNNVTCRESRCLKASWILGTIFTDCWKKLEIILDEEQENLFHKELLDMRELEVTQDEREIVLCIEA